MPTYTYVCTNCAHVTDARFSLKEERPEIIKCEACYQESAAYTLSAPMVTRASYLDGTNRFRDMKEASKLNVEAAKSSSQDTKKEISKEIRKMGVTLTK